MKQPIYKLDPEEMDNLQLVVDLLIFILLNNSSMLKSSFCLNLVNVL